MKALLVDSGCEVPLKFYSKYENLELLGMKVILDEKEYTDDESFDKDRFYDDIVVTNDAHTAHPSIGEIVKKYEELRDRGYDEITQVLFSSKMSGLYNTCQMAIGMTNGIKINLIDTENVSIGSSMIALKIIELFLEKGWDYEKINANLEEIKSSTFMQFTVANFKYLIKNGRIGKAQGLAGMLLNIKPIIGIDEGYLAPIAKVRGMNKVCQTIADNAVNFLKERPYNNKIYLTWGAESYTESMKETFRLFENLAKQHNIVNYEIIESRLAPTIICHSGPEVFGFCAYGEKNPIE